VGENMPFYVWLTIAVLFTIVEILTSGFFFACFAIGAVVAWISGVFIHGAIWQILIFCVVSVGLIPLTRTFARKVTDHSIPQAGVEFLIGRRGFVTHSINPDDDSGAVKVESQEWRAESEILIETGAKIEVVAIKGARLIVKKVNEGENKNAG
jgi:membrane protein implicated in regulation of membrane protease activity